MVLNNRNPWFTFGIFFGVLFLSVFVWIPKTYAWVDCGAISVSVSNWDIQGNTRNVYIDATVTQETPSRETGTTVTIELGDNMGHYSPNVGDVSVAANITKYFDPGDYVAWVQGTGTDGTNCSASAYFTVPDIAPPPPTTCQDNTANNYNQPGDCTYTYGCTDSSAKNYNSSATRDDGSCYNLYRWSGMCGCIQDNTNCTIGNTVNCTTNSDCSGLPACTVPDKVPIGSLDVTSCSQIAGWAYDPDTPDQSINVHMYKDNPAGSGTFIGAITTTVNRSDVNNAFGITGIHGFQWAPAPTSIGGGTHSIYIYGINTNPSGTNPQIGQGTITLPAGYGNACTGATSFPNTCGQTGPGGAGTVQCDGSCSGGTGTTPANPAYYGDACTGVTSGANSCGDTNPGGAGTYGCAGTNAQSNCSGATGSVPAERTNYGAICPAIPSAYNVCNQRDLGTNGTYVCNGGPNSGQGTSCTAVNGVTPPPSQCPAAVATISASPNPVGLGGSSTITYSCTNSFSASVAPDIGPSGSSTGALTSNQTYTVTCDAHNSVTKTNSVTVVVTAPTVTISNNQTLPWNSSPTISWTPANSATCTATNGTTGWAGSKDASNGTHSWTSPSGIQTPGWYAYSIQCFGNGNSGDPVQSLVHILPPVPVASSVTRSHGDYCSSGTGGNINWKFTDPSGSPQTAYQVQILNSSNSVVIDSGKFGSVASPVNSKNYAIPTNVLPWGGTYRARVMVWNTYDQPSTSWSDITVNSTWIEPPYPYPDVIAPDQFTIWPTPPPKPQQNKPITFIDHTVFGGGGNHTWNWNFGDGGTSIDQNPIHMFTSIDNFVVTETATDAAGQSCTSLPQSINVIKPIPVIKEVAPK